jgi:hypothetical protein
MASILIGTGALVVLSVLFGANKSIVDIFSQAFLQSKFFIFSAFAAAFLYRNHARQAFRWLLCLAMAGAVLNLMFPGMFLDHGLKETTEGQLLATQRVGGFQLNPNRLGHTFALVPFTGARFFWKSRFCFRVVLLLSFVFMLLTGSTSSLVMFALGISTIMMNSRMSGGRKLATGLAVIPALLVLIGYGINEMRLDLWGGAQAVGQDSPVFRVLLVVEGARLAIQHFPFGAGLATYATPFAMDVGVYEQTAIYGTFFFSNETGLFDSNLASILGETGLIGVSIIAGLYWLVVDRALKRTGKSGYLRFGIAGVVFLSLCVESLLMNSICSAAFALLIAGITGPGSSGTGAKPEDQGG